MDYLRFLSAAIDGSSLIRCIALAAALLLPAAPVSATIIGSAFDNGDGTFTYSFEVDNSSGSFDIAVWSLELEFLPDWDQLDVFSGGGVAVPDPGWTADAGIPVAGLSAQDFISLGPDSDVLVGATLGGFSFTSAYRPVLVTWYEFSALGDSATGSVIGPGAAPIPEPGALSTFSIGLALVAFAVRRRSPRRSSAA